MLCPVCKEEMIVVEYEKIELDICAFCRGVWFDAEELELLLGALEFLDVKASDLFRPLPEASKEETRRCSYCRSKMEKAVMGAGKDVVIDRCPNGHGLWFDGGELDTVINSLQRPAVDGSGDEAKQATGEVGSFLADILLTDANEENTGGDE
jgi:hypothetical protein